jgi:serine/threonine protein kinase
LGYGAMGRVYEAVRDDLPGYGKVALRVLPDEYFQDSAALDRFSRERRVLAGLEHPGIARLLDSGETPVPYLAAELPEGAPIKRYCQGLSLGKSVQLFLRVCEAVQFAHGQLLLHRDLKSSNILVTPAGDPKILNFGVANFFPDAHGNGDPDSIEPAAGIDPTAPFKFTTDYASPEQFRGGRLGVASDVYSLGAILYELLTGQPPHVTTGVGPAETKRLILTVEPVPPSEAVPPSHRRRLRGDLDYIALKALQKDPARRYSSVESMAADLRGYLLGIPAVGRKAAPIERGGKFLRRNPAVLAGLVVVVVILGMALWRNRLTSEHFRESRELTGRILRQMGESIVNLPGADQSRELLIRSWQNYLDLLSKQSGSDPGMLSELAGGYGQIAALQAASMGGATNAVASYERSERLWQRVVSARPRDVSALRSSAAAAVDHGDFLTRVDRGSEAGSIYSNAVSSAGAALKISPNDPDILALAAGAWVRMADRRESDGDAAGAQAALEQTVALSRRAASLKKNDRNLDALAIALLRLGRMETSHDRAAEARPYLEESLGILQGLNQRNPGLVLYLSPDGVAENSLGMVFDSEQTLSLRDPASAEIHYRRGLELAQATAAADPHDMEAKVDQVVAYAGLCQTLAEVRPADALSACKLARDMGVATAGISQLPGMLQYAALAEIGEARANLKLNRASDAAASAESALRRIAVSGSASIGGDSSRIRALMALGDALAAQRQPERALSGYLTAQTVAGLDFHAMNYAKLQLMVDLADRIMEIAPARRCDAFHEASAAQSELKLRGWPAPSVDANHAGCPAR